MTILFLFYNTSCSNTRKRRILVSIYRLRLTYESYVLHQRKNPVTKPNIFTIKNYIIILCWWITHFKRPSLYYDCWCSHSSSTLRVHSPRTACMSRPKTGSGCTWKRPRERSQIRSMPPRPLLWFAVKRIQLQSTVSAYSTPCSTPTRSQLLPMWTRTWRCISRQATTSQFARQVWWSLSLRIPRHQQHLHRPPAQGLLNRRGRLWEATLMVSIDTKEKPTIILARLCIYTIGSIGFSF